MVSLKYSGKGLDCEPRHVGSDAGSALTSCVALASPTVSPGLASLSLQMRGWGAWLEDPTSSSQL